MDEIKEWKTQSYRIRVASILMLDGVSFSFNEEDGIVFTAPDFYIENITNRLITSYGCPTKPAFIEIK